MTDNVRTTRILYAMCGLAFSGKSTLARRLADIVGAPIVSLDSINRSRGLHGGQAGGMSDAQWEETSRQAVDQLIELMQCGSPVVLDDTLSHRFLRDRYRAVATARGYGFVLVHVDTPVAIVEARRWANEGMPSRDGIEEAVFMQHRERFQPPAGDEAPVRLAGAMEAERWLASLGAFIRKS